MTEFVVAAKTADSGYKVSVQLVYNFSCSVTAAYPFLVRADNTGLVKSLKYKVLVIVFKVVSYLSPYLFEPVACRLVVILCGIVPCFVMYVEDIIFHTVINYLFYTGKPFVAYLILRSFACAPVPRCGNTQNIEACFLDLVDHFLCSIGVAPRFFNRSRILSPVAFVSCVKRVAEAPAYLHILSKLNRAYILDFSLMSR